MILLICFYRRHCELEGYEVSDEEDNDEYDEGDEAQAATTSSHSSKKKAKNVHRARNKQFRGMYIFCKGI